VSQRPVLRPAARSVAVGVLLTIATLLHVVFTPGAWHPGPDDAGRPDRLMVSAAPAPRSAISPAREHPHHSPAAHTVPGAMAASSHRAAGPAAGNPAGPVPAAAPPAVPTAPVHGPATPRDGHVRPRAILPHLLRC
jgi:hypothetical protein